MTSAEIFDAGYAIPGYDIRTDVRHWIYREERFDVPKEAVPLREIHGVQFKVARIDDVRKAAA
jgi:hypothetical protein